jgi:predicted O-linked N-acetylglucosamine transferase (SPINDLY family)
VELAPSIAKVHNNLGVILNELNRPDEAETAFRRALEADPNFVEASGNLAWTVRELGRADEGEAIERRTFALDNNPATLSTLLFNRHYSSRYSAADHTEEARRFGKLVTGRAAKPFTEWLCEADPQRLRVGFVSGDLLDHPVGYFLESVLGRLDRTRIEPIAYVTQAASTALTERIKPLFSAWTPLHGLDDEAAARKIHADGVHVLIDLSGHTRHNRLPVFAWKPAPAQASWIGYFATTGVAEIDYFIADPYLLPEGDDAHFVETPWRLPSAGCLTPPNVAIEPNAPPFLTEGALTFGCFNNLRKVSDEAVALWSRILREAPRARLFLKAPRLAVEAVRETTRARFAAHGISADRLILEGPSPRAEYFKAYHRVDVALDPFPYPGATTSIEGLWMGVPVLTRKGVDFLSRVGESVAYRAGMPEWIAQDDDDYVAKALQLVADPTPLVALRATLREKILKSALYDDTAFASELEDALWGMWSSKGAPRVGHAAPARSQPPTAGALFAAALANQKAGRLDEAVRDYQEILKLQPDQLDVLNNMGVALRRMGRLEEAAASYRRVVELDPTIAGAHNNLGNVLAILRKPVEAEAELRRAIELAPGYGPALSSLAGAVQAQGRWDEALEIYRRAIAAEPDIASTQFGYGALLQQHGRLDEAKAAYREAIRLGPSSPAAMSAILFSQEMMPNFTAEERLENAKAYGEMVSRPVDRRFDAWTCEPRPERLRVGLVSGDLQEHVVAQYLESIFAEIDLRRIEFVGYPTQTTETAATQRIKERFAGGWTPIAGVSDQEAARRIHADGVHVLVDLSGHTLHNRLGLFAWKPAPVQASWIGYFATTGVAEVDYFLCDPYLVPPEDEWHFVEKPWRLPSAGCLTPPRYDIQPGPPPFLTEGLVTFGCFNNPRKVTDEVIALWCRILRSTDRARLFIKSHGLEHEAGRETLLARFAANGIGPDRLLLEGPSGRGKYFEAYHRVDVALDPFPYPGATTSIEGLWMGVPVITRRGDRFLSRVGESIAHRAGMPEWIAADDDDYVAKALAVAADPAPLVALRAGLREKILASPLFDARSFARNLEEALWGMWNGFAGRGA